MPWTDAEFAAWQRQHPQLFQQKRAGLVMPRITEEEYAEIMGRRWKPQPAPPPAPTARAKYRNRKVLVAFKDTELVNGHQRLVHEFASQKEADYYAQLVLRRQIGEIAQLELQVPYALIVHDNCCPDTQRTIIGEWFADFTYFEMAQGQITALRVVDVKGFRTKEYKLKKKIVEACHGITILEV